jgi:hypothetical protein
MSTMPSKEINVAVMELLEDNWDASNTSADSAPKFHTGIYDEDANKPQVSVTTVSETPIGGGETGYSYLSAGGSQGGQDRDGVVDVGLWADRRDVQAVNAAHPKKLTYEFHREVNRIVMDNQTNLSEVRYLGPTDSELLVEGDRQPVVFHRVQTLTYGYAHE